MDKIGRRKSFILRSIELDCHERIFKEKERQKQKHSLSLSSDIKKRRKLINDSSFFNSREKITNFKKPTVFGSYKKPDMAYLSESLIIKRPTKPFGRRDLQKIQKPLQLERHFF